jgi:hypothetical protein
MSVAEAAICFPPSAIRQKRQENTVLFFPIRDSRLAIRDSDPQQATDPRLASAPTAARGGETKRACVK